MVLNSKSLLGLITGQIDDSQIQQVGIDLTVKSISRCMGGMVLKDLTKLEATKSEPTYNTPVIGADGVVRPAKLYLLTPGHYEVRFNEGCIIPPAMMALILHRTSILRSGGTMISGVWDPGFKTEEMGCFLTVHNVPSLTIEVGARVAQMFYLQAEECAKELLYNGQFQGK